jgi:ABC-2 type transport system permease protein
MIRDIATMVWKEWKEVFLLRGTLRRGIVSSLVIPLGLIGVFMPWQEGPGWANSSVMAVFSVWVPAFLVSTMICESFAGERERKTLETLLASRLDDRTILFGKIAAAVGYGWGIALASIGLGFITVNVFHAHGTLILLPAQTVFAVGSISLLASGLIASAGVLISLRAPTIRQAQQTMSLTLLGTLFGSVFGVNALPVAYKQWLLATFAGGNIAVTILSVCAALLALDAFMIATAMARFQRARLILD